MSTLPDFVQMTYDDWIDRYQPVRTDGQVFVGLDDPRAEDDPRHVWTLMTGDNGSCQFIVPGRHWVNRDDYAVTAVPWEHEGIEVWYDDECEECGAP